LWHSLSEPILALFVRAVKERQMEELLTAEEVAVYLRVHLMTVRRWCRSGRLPAAKVGRAYRIKKGDLDEWWAKHAKGAEEVDSRSSTRSATPAGQFPGHVE
jgi:excisionase family DNA binding protein